MPTYRLQLLIGFVAVVVLALPVVTRAGDAPIVVVGSWGIGEIDGKIMFYLGKGHYLDTPIPAPPHGPRWDIVSSALQFAIVGNAGFWLYRRRHNPTLQRSGEGGFEKADE